MDWMFPGYLAIGSLHLMNRMVFLHIICHRIIEFIHVSHVLWHWPTHSYIAAICRCEWFHVFFLYGTGVSNEWHRTWTGSSYRAPALPPWFPFWKSIVSPEYWGWQVLESIQLGSTPMITVARAWGIIECNCWTNTSPLQRTLNLKQYNCQYVHQLSKCPTCQNHCNLVTATFTFRGLTKLFTPTSCKCPMKLKPVQHVK